MSVENVFRSILKTTAAYEQALQETDAANFEAQPAIGGWTSSEVYCHIFDSSLLSLMAINECISGRGKKTRPTAFLVKLILFVGILPPGVKYKVPPKLALRIKKIDIPTANELISDFNLKLKQTKFNLKNADPRVKTKHPVLGYLNATQWLKFTEIHLKHHLKQLSRIKNSLR